MFSNTIIELQWLEHLWNHENMFKTGVVQANKCYSLLQVRRHDRDIFSNFFNMKVCCVSSLESPHRLHTIYHFNYKNIIPNKIMSAAIGDFHRGSRTCSKHVVH